MERLQALSRHLCSGVATSAHVESALEKWHQAVDAGMGGDTNGMLDLLEDLLCEEILFLAPTYYKERRSKTFVKMALVGVSQAFKNFKYTRTFFDENGFALEFETNIGSEDGPLMRGIDLVTVNESGQVTRFEVMARPPKAVMQLLEFQNAFFESKKK